MIRMDLFRVITDIENLYYRLNEGKAKREWRQRDLDEFNVVKHRLLDKAGEIGRLPSAMLLNDLPNGAENELCTGDGLVLLCASPWGETER